MRARRRSAIGVGGLGLSYLVGVSAATAVVAAKPATSKIPLELTFVGAPGCDEASTLRREVERRSDVVRWVSDGAAVGTAKVRITSGFSRYEAEIVVDGPSLPRVTRVIASSACREALEGAALVIAVVLSSSVDRDPPPTFRLVERPEARPLRHDPLRWELGVGAAALTSFGVAPAQMLGFEALADVSSYGTGWAPAVRLGFRHSEQRAFEFQGDRVQAAFRLDSVRLSACPIAWLVARDFVTRACALGHFGRLGATAYAVETKRTTAHPWLGFGGTLRLEARVLPELSLELEGSYETTPLTSRFWFAGHELHESGRSAGEIALSLVARVPQ